MSPCYTVLPKQCHAVTMKKFTSWVKVTWKKRWKLQNYSYKEPVLLNLSNGGTF